eukprot:scaffold16261_cov20-Tisochrysis_lutea.AAC.1
MAERRRLRPWTTSSLRVMRGRGERPAAVCYGLQSCSGRGVCAHWTYVWSQQPLEHATTHMKQAPKTHNRKLQPLPESAKNAYHTAGMFVSALAHRWRLSYFLCYDLILLH